MSGQTFGLTRRRLLGGLVAGAAACALPAPAIARRAGRFRALTLNNLHTGEWLSTAYWIDGDYLPEAMDAISYILRDWRAEAVKPIAPETMDILAAMHRKLETEEPLQIISGYRTPETNAMLRSRSRGVARKSYHMKAMAVDLSMESRDVRQLARAAESLGAGGVGRYSRSEFIHVDSGPVRTWGR
jgi:uncharacterized protein YcbK (DUF882 family)